MSEQTIIFNYRWRQWLRGAVVTLPAHVANAFLEGDAPNGQKWASVHEAAESVAVTPELEEEPVTAADALEDLTKAELKARCESLGLSVSGKKSDLIDRLLEAQK